MAAAVASLDTKTGTETYLCTMVRTGMGSIQWRTGEKTRPVLSSATPETLMQMASMAPKRNPTWSSALREAA